jgi:hypothetical protein
MVINAEKDKYIDDFVVDISLKIKNTLKILN